MSNDEEGSRDPIFDDRQLRLVVKSLSITYDALSTKLNRAQGRIYEETLTEFETCSDALTIARTAQSARLRHAV
jgi:hypothetical protein